MPSVGRNVRRKDGDAKVTGKAKYIDDLTFPGMLYGATVRSTIPRGRIVARTVSPGNDFITADYRDIPGDNYVALIDPDQPCLAAQEVRHFAEPILLVAHADKQALAAIHDRVTITYEEQRPNYDPEQSAICFKKIAIDKGDLERGFADAAGIIDGEYRTGHQEQLYIETNGVIAVPGDEEMTVYGSLQCPYYVHKALTVVLGLAPERVRVIQAETGGGFGGKEEYPSTLACHAAILARKARRPVKMIYDRVEDMLATTKRHPSIVRHRTGVTRDGRLTAMDIEVVMDGGAYATLSAVVLSRGVIHASGPYRCDHIRIRGRAMMTNTPPNGAFRGFGAPQTQFAVEAHMDRIAEQLRLDPVRLRELNALRPGDTTATGQKLGRDASALPVLREAVRRSDFRKKRRRWNGTDRGIGLSLFFHGQVLRPRATNVSRDGIAQVDVVHARVAAGVLERHHALANGQHRPRRRPAVEDEVIEAVHAQERGEIVARVGIHQHAGFRRPGRAVAARGARNEAGEQAGTEDQRHVRMKREQALVEQAVEVVHIRAASAEQRPRHGQRRIRRHGFASLEIDEQGRALRGELRRTRQLAQQLRDALADAHA